MKLTRPRTLGTLAIAGTLVGATLVLGAPQASAKPMADFIDTCNLSNGRIGIATYYDFDVNGNVVSQTQVAVCRFGPRWVMWNDTDIHGEPYGN